MDASVWLGLGAGLLVTMIVARKLATAFWTLRALAPTPTLSRRLSRWVRARSYSDADFFRADGAPAAWGERRRQGIASLAGIFRTESLPALVPPSGPGPARRARRGRPA